MPGHEHWNSDKAAERCAVRSARKYQDETVEPCAGPLSHHACAVGGIGRDSGVAEHDHDEVQSGIYEGSG
jgi:hypothetical protein